MKKLIMIIVSFILLTQLEAVTFTRDTITNIVTDSRTNLQWQDDNAVKTIKKSWQDAIDYCEGLTLGGKSDWRLPNYNELYSSIDRTRYNPSLDSAFVNYIANENFPYWTSTTQIAQTNYAWDLDLYDGFDRTHTKTTLQYFRCVRGGL